MMAALQDTVTSDPVTIGKISYWPKELLGYGSHLTVVYRGLYGKRKVAVKKIPSHFAAIAEKEKDLLDRIDVNHNIVRCYDMEQDNDGYYIALMLCDYTLVDYVKPEADNMNLTPIKVLKEVTLGLQFLHESKIIHHDLKPLNILISYPNRSNERKAMISDFGISKQTMGTRDSVTLTTRRGTDGFVAPEVFADDTVTNAVDVFALGCIYYYVFSKGKQIFHSTRDVEDETMFQICIDRFLKTENPNDYFSLVLRMIDRDATSRPTCDQVLFHHMYWPAQEKMQFLQVISDFMEGDDRKSVIDNISSELTGDNWLDQMSDNVIKDLVYGKYNQGRKKSPKELPNENVRILIQKYYDGTKTSSLLRAIRNICNHYDDIIIHAKDEISSDECFMDYCCSKFPKLFSKIYEIAEQWISCKKIGKFYINKTCQVGQITFQMEPKIKIARNGNILYKGQYKDCKVAIKMYKADWSSLGKNQWDLLQNIKHQNVVRLLHKEEEDNCLYIVTTLGQYNLFEYVENYWNNDNPTPLQLLEQVTNGLAYLHAWNIVHCDLTPANILIFFPNKMKKGIAMIADMESSHNCDVSDFTRALKSKKLSKDWMAPELQKSDDIYHMSEAVDIYSLGCIYIFMLSNVNQIFGKHSPPAGHSSPAQHISESITATGLESYHGLLHHMLEYSPNLRPSSAKILCYPIFWDKDKKLAFVKDVIQLMKINNHVEDLLFSCPGDTGKSNEHWITGVSEFLVTDLVRAHQSKESSENNEKNIIEKAKEWYGGNKLSSVICCMIEISKNYDGIIRDSKTLFKDTPGGYIQYFITCFPQIPDFMYSAMRGFEEEPILRRYYAIGKHHLRDKFAKCNWSNLNGKILHSILSKTPINPEKCYQLLCKGWQENERKFCTDLIRRNCVYWTKTSLANVLGNYASCRKDFWALSEKWKTQPAPTLLNTVKTGMNIAHVSFSFLGALLAVCSQKSIKIYNTKDFSIRDTKHLKDKLHSVDFNYTDTCIVVKTSTEMKVFAIADRLVDIHSVSCNITIRRPWFSDNIFLSAKRETDMTTFWLNEIKKSGNNGTRTNQCQIFKVMGFADLATIIMKATPIRNVLVYKSGETKLGIKIFEDFTEFPKKQCNGKLQTPDQEFDCKGEIINYTYAPYAAPMFLSILTKVEDNDYCFLILYIDTNKCQLQACSLLVPKDYCSFCSLDSNNNYIISGNESKYTYIWDLKSEAFMAKINHREKMITCALQRNEPHFAVTAGVTAKKIYLWRLNTHENTASP